MGCVSEPKTIQRGKDTMKRENHSWHCLQNKFNAHICALWSTDVVPR